MYRTRLMSLLLCLAVMAISQPGAALEWVDDFETVATYDINTVLNHCYGGPFPKYTLIELVNGDVFSEQAVSGGGRLRISNSALGQDLIPGFGRFEHAMVGWLGLGVGCLGEPLINQSSHRFTNSDLCLYGGYTFNRFQLEHIKQGNGEDWGEELGLDGAPGFAGVDDDGNGTTDDPNPMPLTPTGDGASPEYLWPGADGAPGVAGVDDDGINGTDDQGEFAWPGSDDSDDTIGRWGLMAGMRINLDQTNAMYIDIDPQRLTGQFTIRELFLTMGAFLPTPPDGQTPGSYNAFTNYNYLFCASGTCYGAMMWQETDLANPRVVMGPLLNSRHNGPGDAEVALATFHINNGRHAFLRNATHIGNMNFSHSFWVIEGGVNTNFPSHSADLDGDRDIDGTDFLTFSNCFNGALKPPNIGVGCLAAAGRDADLDNDNDVDGTDFLTFSNCFNGALHRPAAQCMPASLDTLIDCAVPANNTCAGATVISDGVPIQDSLGMNLTLTVPPSCDVSIPGFPNIGNDLWYVYTPPCTGTATLTTCGTNNLANPNPDVIMAAYSSCGGTELLCQNANNCTTGGNYEEFDVSVTAGVDIYIQVTGENFNDFGDIELLVTCNP